MYVMVLSTTPPQFASVGAWVTTMPSSVAASMSISSTPTVYLATMRRVSEAIITSRLMPEPLMDVPTSASAWAAISTSFPCGSPVGSAQDAAPSTMSQPAASSSGCVSVAGAKMTTLGLAMKPPLAASLARGGAHDAPCAMSLQPQARAPRDLGAQPGCDCPRGGLSVPLPAALLGVRPSCVAVSDKERST